MPNLIVCLNSSCTSQHARDQLTHTLSVPQLRAACGEYALCVTMNNTSQVWNNRRKHLLRAQRAPGCVRQQRFVEHAHARICTTWARVTAIQTLNDKKPPQRAPDSQTVKTCPKIGRINAPAQRARNWDLERQRLSNSPKQGAEIRARNCARFQLRIVTRGI